MARYTGPVCRLCRRERTKLFLKGDRCYGPMCACNRRAASVGGGERGGRGASAERRPTTPGEHGQARARKQSEYGIQLREKQKARRTYGMMEGQFKRTFSRAERMKGITGENLLILLELRLDNVIYRLGLASSRAQARQLVLHGHFRVNGKKVTIPSYQVKADDEITLRTRSQEIEHFKALREGTGRVVPKWLSLDAENLKAKVVALPVREDIDVSLQEHLIVELYSR